MTCLGVLPGLVGLVLRIRATRPTSDPPLPTSPSGLRRTSRSGPPPPGPLDPYPKFGRMNTTLWSVGAPRIRRAPRRVRLVTAQGQTKDCAPPAVVAALGGNVVPPGMTFNARGPPGAYITPHRRTTPAHRRGRRYARDIRGVGRALPSTRRRVEPMRETDAGRHDHSPPGLGPSGLHPGLSPGGPAGREPGPTFGGDPAWDIANPRRIARRIPVHGFRGGTAPARCTSPVHRSRAVGPRPREHSASRPRSA